MSDYFSEKSSQKPAYIAYSVEQGKDDKSHWQRIGAAWETKGEGLSLKLNSIPLDGKIALRSREQLEKMREQKKQKPQHNQSLEMK